MLNYQMVVNMILPTAPNTETETVCLFLCGSVYTFSEASWSTRVWVDFFTKSHQPQSPRGAKQTHFQFRKFDATCPRKDDWLVVFVHQVFFSDFFVWWDDPTRLSSVNQCLYNSTMCRLQGGAQGFFVLLSWDIPELTGQPQFFD